MAKYYNTTRGPLAVSLSSGASLSIPPKKWVEIGAADEGSTNLVPLVRKGYLKRSALADLPATPVVEVSEPTVLSIEDKESPAALPKFGEVKTENKKK